MRVLLRGNQPVYHGNGQHAAEKGRRGGPASDCLPKLGDKRLLRLRKYFYKGNINHYARRKAQTDGEESLVGMPCHKSDAAADACAQAGQHRKCKGQ